MKDYILQGLWSEVDFTALRSRGPGGQNVNKVSSAAHAVWNFQSSNLINTEEKFLIRGRLASYINKDEMLYVRSDEYRDLPRNKERCIEKILELLERAFHKDKPRKATKATRASKLRKLEGKSKRSEVKKNRKKTWSFDD